MTYGCDLLPGHVRALDGAVVSHSAELVRGNFTSSGEGPLIRPSGTFSPRGEGFPRGAHRSMHRKGKRRVR
jgi:hypothetical protein